MNPFEWLHRLVGGKLPQDDKIRVEVERHQVLTAERLSRLSGRSTEDVLSEANRRARLLDEDRSYRRSRG